MERRRLILGLPALALPAFVLARSTARTARGASRQLPDDPPPQFVVGIPGLAADGHPLVVTLSTQSAFQGGAVLVTASAGEGGTVSLLGRSYALAPDGEGLSAILGLGIGDPPGGAPVSVTVEGPLGPESWSGILTVVATDWTVDYITIPPPPPPDPDAPPPPPPPPDETSLLPILYSGLTPRRWEPGWSSPLETMRVTGYFGEQRSFNGGPVQGHHGGTDFGADFGTPILATNHGTVILSGLYYWRGNIVIVDHGQGLFSLYGHMEERLVAEGETVTKGQVLGRVGSTGLSTGAHLHWEMAAGGILVDGLRWLDGSQGF